MSDDRDLMKVVHDEGFVAMIKEAFGSLDSIVTGALGSDTKYFLMMPGRLVQGFRNRDFLLQFAKEFEDLKKQGKIKGDYIKTEQGQACLQELLSALENPPVDEIKFKALKNIFIKASTESLNDRDQSTPILLMSIAKQMSGGAILLLAANYKIKGQVPTTDSSGYAGTHVWIERIRSASDFQQDGLIEFYEDELIRNKLIQPRHPERQDRVMVGANARLTDLGLKMSQYLLENER